MYPSFDIYIIYRNLKLFMGATMSSESKKRKADCDTHQRYGRFTNGFALKWKGIRGKRGIFFNSAQRMQEKKELKKELENLEF